VSEVRWSRLAVLLALVAGLAGCGGPSGDGAAGSPTLLFADFAKREPAIATLTVRAPGDRVAVTLQRDGKQWRVAERAGWPADTARVETLLGDLASARRIEPKTTQPDRYAKLALQPIADRESLGVRLDIDGGDAPLRLLLGKPKGDTQRFVRLDGDAQAWLVDRPLRAPADPLDWLDTRLVDAPRVQVERVEVALDSGQAFTLSHRDDRFRIDGVPTAAMGDSHAGDALAGVLDHLAFEDVARDDGTAKPERTVRFTGQDGAWIELAAWRIDGRLWVRATRGAEGKLANAFAHATDGWRFRLPAFQAAALMASRSQILGAAQ
jgi:Domain of unknown function (DUF4340)